MPAKCGQWWRNNCCQFLLHTYTHCLAICLLAKCPLWCGPCPQDWLVPTSFDNKFISCKVILPEIFLSNYCKSYKQEACLVVDTDKTGCNIQRVENITQCRVEKGWHKSVLCGILFIGDFGPYAKFQIVPQNITLCQEMGDFLCGNLIVGVDNCEILAVELTTFLPKDLQINIF